MLKESSETLEGNDRFEGFAVDVIDEISKLIGFDYVFQIVGDGKYGALVSSIDFKFYILN